MRTRPKTIHTLLVLGPEYSTDSYTSFGREYMQINNEDIKRQVYTVLNDLVEEGLLERTNVTLNNKGETVEPVSSKKGFKIKDYNLLQELFWSEIESPAISAAVMTGIPSFGLGLLLVMFQNLYFIIIESMLVSMFMISFIISWQTFRRDDLSLIDLVQAITHRARHIFKKKNERNGGTAPPIDREVSES